MSKKNWLFVILSSLLLSAALVSGVLWFGSRPPKRGGPFTLNHRGQDWVFIDHAKKLNLVYVGYAKCPDVCPMSLSFAAQSFRKLSPDQLQKTQLIFISVDTENDTPTSVADYAIQFYPTFVGLTGAKEKIDQTIQAIGASYMVEKDPKSYLGYSIAHSDRIFFLDQNGFVQDTLPNPRSEELLTQKIKDLL